ncbi:MAG: hypothetical protein MUO31_07330, partial [Thermodesulfovibrionales bacterium]|nr:hypothetical protein [Thermodesulfovibrionales bacterium]
PTHLPQYDHIYPRIAQQIEDCQFLFISNPKKEEITEQFHIRISEAFRRFNLNPEEYIVFLPFLDSGKYLEINRISHAFLDTIGWSACNSAFEAIACNLPIVTLPGEFMRGRHTPAILTMMGVTDTVVSTSDEYVALAVRLGKDSEYRHQISEKIAINKHLIYGDKTCITALEDFLEAAVRKKLK